MKNNCDVSGLFIRCEDAKKTGGCFFWMSLREKGSICIFRTPTSNCACTAAIRAAIESEKKDEK